MATLGKVRKPDCAKCLSGSTPAWGCHAGQHRFREGAKGVHSRSVSCEGQDREGFKQGHAVGEALTEDCLQCDGSAWEEAGDEAACYPGSLDFDLHGGAERDVRSAAREV